MSTQQSPLTKRISIHQPQLTKSTTRQPVSQEANQKTHHDPEICRGLRSLAGGSVVTKPLGRKWVWVPTDMDSISPFSTGRVTIIIETTLYNSTPKSYWTLSSEVSHEGTKTRSKNLASTGINQTETTILFGLQLLVWLKIREKSETVVLT